MCSGNAVTKYWMLNILKYLKTSLLVCTVSLALSRQTQVENNPSKLRQTNMHIITTQVNTGYKHWPSNPSEGLYVYYTIVSHLFDCNTWFAIICDSLCTPGLLLLVLICVALDCCNSNCACITQMLV